MCGIAGLLNINGERLADASVAARMASLLVHRGPDAEGIFSDGPVSLGFRRLSIIDVATGNQPIPNEDRSIWIVFNGEIYNYLELREELAGLGHKFSTRTDTETMVHAYESWGPEFVRRLRGMFGFAIWDGNTRKLILGRDPVGKKPLYYSMNGGELAFASEMKALLAWPGLDRNLSAGALNDYLTYLYVPGASSIFASVKKLLPGHILIANCNSGSIDIRRFWQIESQPDRSRPFEYWVDGVRERVEEAVRLRLRSDVPLGSLLSGGIDSSIVSGVASKMVPGLRTFGISFTDPRFDESEYATAAAASFATIHTQDTVDAETFTPDDLTRLVWHMDEPFGDSSFLPTYWVCRAARRHVTVALSGDGGDELFGGYTRYRNFERLRQLSRLPLPLKKTAGALLPALHRATRLEPLRQAAKALRLSELDMPKQIAALHSFFGEADKALLYSRDWSERVDYSATESGLARMTDAIGGSSDEVAQFMATEFGSSMVDDSLVKLDRASMACSLEVRSPLLDRELAEFSMRIPPEFKLRNGQHKIVLKRAFDHLLPETIRRRGKQGFELPFGSWFRRPQWRDFLIDTLSEQTLRSQGIFEPARLIGWRDSILRESGVNSGISDYQLRHRVWGLLVFQLWHGQYMGQGIPAGRVANAA
jgi:asparagine synthase (glutamine-hydrolysing)